MILYLQQNARDPYMIDIYTHVNHFGQTKDQLIATAHIDCFDDFRTQLLADHLIKAELSLTPLSEDDQ
jgi:hypothetical protein